MRGDPVQGQKPQQSTIHRCKFYFKMNNLKPFQHTVVTTLLKDVVYALQEKMKFLNHIGKRKWSCELHTIGNNMLRPTATHDVLNENQSNEDHVLTALLKVYDRPFPALSEQLKNFTTLEKNIKTLTRRVALGIPEHWK